MMDDSEIHEGADGDKLKFFKVTLLPQYQYLLFSSIVCGYGIQEEKEVMRLLELPNFEHDLTAMKTVMDIVCVSFHIQCISHGHATL
jgi:hypothetical protein